VVMDRGCGVLGWIDIRGAIDGWQIEVRPSPQRHLLSRAGWPSSSSFQKWTSSFSPDFGRLWRPCARVVGFLAVFSLEVSVVTCVQLRVVLVLF
jgi:hypothetical protein